MKINKIIGTFVAVMGLGMVVAAPSMAQQQTFASATAAGGFASDGFTYTTGLGGGFDVTPGATFTAEFLPTGATTPFPTATLSFGANSLRNKSLVVNGMDYTEHLTGGTFTLFDSATSTLLLSGKFGGGDLLKGTQGASTASLVNTLTNVTYTGGTYFTASGFNNPGAFSIALTSVIPNVGITSGYLDSFAAGGTGTFSARIPAPTPEPATVVPFMLGGLGLLGLIVRKTRRTSGAAA